MPLSCRDDRGAPLYAFAADAGGWAALIADNRARQHLRAPCCEARVALKTSTRGTRFFAHVARGGCATGDESAEHLWLKAQAVAAAQRHGWDAATEIGGDGWRADVLATKGRSRVAVEIQWSPQDDAETLRRQARYAAAGVRALWLFRQRRFPLSEAVPAVRVAGSLVAGLTALDMPVAAVLDAAFDRRLRFGFPAGAKVEVRVDGAVQQCWRDGCGTWNRVVGGIELRFGRSRCTLALADVPEASPLFAALVAGLPADPMLATVRVRFSRTQTRRYVGNGCFRCDALFGAQFVPGGDRVRLAGFNLGLDAALAAMLAAHPACDAQWSVLPARA